MYNKRLQGFTLIELLVVIAIIGILSAVVLASLSTARNKAKDAAVISDIDGVRTQAQIYYNDHNNYGSNVAVVNDADCSPAAAAGTIFGDDTTVVKQVQAAITAGGTGGGVTCNVDINGSAYAVSVALIATPGTYYCADSTSVGTTTTVALGTNTQCP